MILLASHIYEFNEFRCTQCGERGIPIVRRIGAAREAGHLKKLWCLKCKKETNHVECKANTKYQVSDFEIEFKYHNFTTDGKRILPYSKLKEMIKNGKIMATNGNSGDREEYLDQES